jgi:hypothetical protein
MKLTGNTHSDNEARVDLSARTERDPLSANAELSGRALFANTSHEDENAVNLVDLYGQDPRRPDTVSRDHGIAHQFTRHAELTIPEWRDFHLAPPDTERYCCSRWRARNLASGRSGQRE